MERGGRCGGGAAEGGKMGEAAAVVEEGWGCFEWQSEGWEQSRRKRRTKRTRKMWKVGTCS